VLADRRDRLRRCERTGPAIHASARSGGRALRVSRERERRQA
jgi:hypothetical protein